jgi:hypothetical protein
MIRLASVIGSQPKGNAMSDIEITLRLPEELVQRAHAAGIAVEMLTPDLIDLLEQKIRRKQAWQHLSDIANQLRGNLSEQEIEEELAAAKDERISQR